MADARNAAAEPAVHAFAFAAAIDPDDCPTVVAPYPGARVCGALWCTAVAERGTDRCKRHGSERSR
jgi:hypothetical protein